MVDERWNDCLLGDLITLQRGYDITKKEQNDGPYPVVSSSGPSSTHSEYTDVGPGVLIGRKGTLGKAFYINGPYWAHDTTLWVKDFKGNDRKFIFYLLKSMNLATYDVGSSNPTLNRNHLHLLPARAPDVDKQQRISDILSAFDNLIEVNQQRIAILEDMARRLFDEWFVRFRYPGHEAVPLVETELGMVPEGWTPARLGSLLTLSYGKALKAEQRRGGPVPVFGSSGIVGEHDQRLVQGPGIIVGRKGNVGSVHWSSHDFYPIDTVFFVETDMPLRWVYQLLKRQTFLNSDAAVPGLNREQAYAMKVIRPDPEPVGRYSQLVEPLFQQLELLTVHNTRLRAARDLLLPKLISGEIDVSAAEVTFAEAAE